MSQTKALPVDGIPIGELSRRTGVHIETIRYYEKGINASSTIVLGGGHNTTPVRLPKLRFTMLSNSKFDEPDTVSFPTAEFTCAGNGPAPSCHAVFSRAANP